MKIGRRKFIQAASLTTANLAIFPLAGNTNGIAELFETASQKGDQRASVLSLSGLRQRFMSPPDHSKPSCYWWWFNSLVNKEGITRDLKEFKEKGMGGVLLINSISGFGGGPIPNGPAFLSPEWRELFRHTLTEADRFGIEVGVNLSTGWAMGGAWIKPEYSGRWFLQSKLIVTGPQRFSGKLPLPGNRDGYDNAGQLFVKKYVDLPLEEADYRDTAIMAFPEPQEGSRFSDGRLNLLAVKSNRFDASSHVRAKETMEAPLKPWIPTPDDRPVAASQVIDLTSKMTPDGQLEWNVPPGKWTIIRTGHRMTGSRTAYGLPDAEGLEIDWLNEAGVEQQFKYLGRELLSEADRYKGRTLKYFHSDSFEDGFPNWTDNFLDKFIKYRGYDARPYLPVFSGHIIDNAEISDRFLYDYRKTVADCMADGHYKRFAELCHENKILAQSEAGGPSWSGTMCMDALKNLGRMDMPMGEFWQGTTFIQDDQNQTCKIVASAAHIYGKKVISAEAFTSFKPHWSDTPEVLKPVADRAFCEGINRCVIHTSTATRPEDGKPGYEYGAGTHFNPNITWWDQSSGFLSYISRCQHLLQSGKFVANVLYYNGDWAPNLVSPKHVDPLLGKGYDYDVCNEEVLLTRVSVKNNKLVLPDGISYHVLVLPNTKRMPVEVAKKIRELVKAGATVIGQRPEKDPGLKNFPKSDREVEAISAEVWGDCNGENVTMHRYGKGQIVQGLSIREILKQDGLVPDFEYTGDSETYIDFIHRSLEDGIDVYFVANRNERVEKIDCKFRISGRQPEIWDPVSGKTRTAEDFNEIDGQIILPLEFLSHQSFFIVFPELKTQKQITDTANQKNNFTQTQSLQEITGPWLVKFDPQWGGPAEIEFEELQDWSKSPKDGIKYYSGKAVYMKKFDLPHPIVPDSSLLLDLGVVKNIAEVKLNGKNLGIVWTSPWRVDISEAIKETGNVLEIEVTNLWPNRLIGDAALSPEQRLTHTNIEFKSDAPLLSSGLLGPVKIMTGK